ncbi:thiamine ABC transporter ATP-binding protein ThiQ [Orbaceae bacterium ESL0727]|nr:thiamine ABC transporter ATP-binding protein ThiQ [Orbaceae bacterium ESL0727]
MMITPTMIALNNVYYQYRAELKHHAIKQPMPTCIKMHFDLQIGKGERVVVIGPSGAGKSTLLNLIAGFVQPKAGEIILDQQDMTQIIPGKRPVSMLFQDNNLFEHLTVAQNVALGLKPSLKLTPAQQQSIATILAKVGLADQKNRYPNQLSGGQKQRIALARCLVQHRPILLLDEPFSALDQALRFEMLSLVNHVCDEFDLTLMMVSHYLDASLAQFTRCLVVNKGEIVFNDKPAELYQPKYSNIATLLGINCKD